MNKRALTKEKGIALLACFVCAFLFVTLCSRCSFLYELNDWCDANAFLTEGRAMLQGKVLYKDIYEHKGLYICMLHMLAALISETSFFGVYILEVFAFTVFLFYTYKIMRLYVNKNCILAVPIVAGLVLSSYAFCQGDSAEEWCTPLIIISLYMMLNFVKNKKDKTVKANKLLWIIMGIITALILWTKYTLLTFHIGVCFFVVIFYLHRKDIVSIFKVAGLWLFGIIIGSVPLIIYFFVNDAFGDLWQVYFYNLIFVYGAKSNVLVSSILKALSFVINPFITGIIGFGLIKIIKDKENFSKPEKLLIIITLVFNLVSFLFLSGDKIYLYTFFTTCAFMGIGCVGSVGLLLNKKSIGRKKLIFALEMVLMLVYCYFMSTNTFMISYEKEDYVYYNFADEINKSDDKSLYLYNCYDAGYYLTTDTIPSVKYFSLYNVSLPEIEAEKYEMITGGKTKYVVTVGEKPEIVEEYYELIMQQDYVNENELDTYYLWERK